MTANPEQTPHYGELSQHIGKYIKPNDVQAYLAIGVSILFEVLAVGLIQLNFYWLGWFIHSLNMVRLFIQFHDMAHFSFF